MLKPRVYTRSEQVMDMLRGKIYASEHDYRVIARRCGVSESTIYAIRRGATRWPRPATFFALIEFFDLQLVLAEREELN